VVPRNRTEVHGRGGERMSEILVTGGNGFVGRHVVRALQKRGDGVRVLALPGEDTRQLEAHGVSVHEGDIRRAESLTAPMREVDAVLHLAAMMDVWRSLADYREVNVTGTENVCRAALASGVRRLVHMSSSSVYGVALGRPADESFPLSPFPDPYPLTKAAGDELVQRMIRDHDLPAVIVRPDQIFGPGDHLHFGRMAERIGAGRSIIVGSGRNSLPLVHVDDITQALLLALDHDRAVGRVYNVSAERPLTQQQFVQAIADAIGAPAPRVHAPYRLLYAAGYAAERLARFRRSGARPPITRLGVAFMGTDNQYTFDRARRELGYVPRVALPDAVRLTAAWYLERAERQSGRVPTRTPRSAEEVGV
jgi:nucleoside-diphosphate-sugar epimerase